MSTVLLHHMQLQLFAGEAPLITERTFVALRCLAIDQLLAHKEDLKVIATVDSLHGMIVLVLLARPVLALVKAVAAIGHCSTADNTLVAPSQITTRQTAQALP